jgi:hypothetical protein
MKKIVFQIMYGGLGDHLFYSPLPRLAKEAGYEKVYISSLSPFRHPDYKKLIWDCNPYIDGFVDEEGVEQFFDVIPIIEKYPDFNILDAIVFAHGLDDGKRWREPEMYFKPEIREDLKNAIVYDPNFVSNVGMVKATGIEKYFRKNNIFPDFQFKVRGETNYPITIAKNEIFTPTIEEYISVIVSCKAFYCLTSGGATLASALGKPCFAFYSYGQGKIFHHSRLHTYIYVPSLETEKIVWRNKISLAVKKYLPWVHQILKKMAGKK